MRVFVASCVFSVLGILACGQTPPNTDPNGAGAGGDSGFENGFGGTSAGGTSANGGTSDVGGTSIVGGSADAGAGGVVEVSGGTTSVSEGGTTVVAQGGASEGGSVGSGGATDEPVLFEGEILPPVEGQDFFCGTELITWDEWHADCGTDVGACQVGQTQCESKVVDGVEVHSKVCWGEIKPAEKSNKCYEDKDCNGLGDNGTGIWSPVPLVKSVGVGATITVGVGDKAIDVTDTFPLTDPSAPLCRNNVRVCINPSQLSNCTAGNNCVTWDNGGGVFFDDYKAAENEDSIGESCNFGIGVYTCVLEEEGIVSVQCVNAGL